MKVTRTITKDITKCYHECPYFGLEGHEMICEHPYADADGGIITHPDCDKGFPEDCPMMAEAK